MVRDVRRGLFFGDPQIVHCSVTTKILLTGHVPPM